MSVKCGYDEEFVDTPADYLKCVLCCLVLKDPVQIMRCGHRYCTTCFQQLKKYSQHLNSPFICPIDRDEIDLAQVFNDTGMNRIVADLKVKCSFHQEGCVWSGELRGLNEHKNQCSHNGKSKSPTVPHSEREDSALMKDMCKRMDKCEEILYEKEKEIGHMKLILQETKEKVDERDEEVKLLKMKTGEMEAEIVLLKESNRTLKDEVDSVHLQCEGYYKESNGRIFQLNGMVENCVKPADGGEIKSVMANLEELTNDVRNLKIDSNTVYITTAMKSVESDLQNVQQQLQRIENQNGNVTSGLQKSVRDLKSQWGGLQSKTDKFMKLVDNRQQCLNEIYEELQTGRTQQLSVEMITNPNSPFIKNTQFVWRINDFKERFDAKKRFDSDKFYCFPHGHVCQLFCFYRYEQNDMGIGIRLCQDRYLVDTALFQASVSIEFIYNNGGNRRCQTITPEDIHSHREQCFAFKEPLLIKYTAGLLCSKLLFKEEEMKQYAEGKVSTVICTVTPLC